MPVAITSFLVTVPFEVVELARSTPDVIILLDLNLLGLALATRLVLKLSLVTEAPVLLTCADSVEGLAAPKFVTVACCFGISPQHGEFF